MPTERALAIPSHPPRLTSTLRHFLRSSVEAELFWGPSPGVKGGDFPFSFELRVVLSNDLQVTNTDVFSNTNAFNESHKQA